MCNNNKIEIIGLEKALKESKEWLSRDIDYSALIMLDRGTGDVWCDTFIDGNTWKEYYDSAIIDLCLEIFSRYNIYGREKETLEKYAKILCEEYATAKREEE